MINFLLVAYLVIATTSLDMDQEIYKQYKQIDSDDYGKTLIDALQLHLKSKEPISNYIDSMRNLEQKFQEDQREDDDSNRQFQDSCNTDLDALEAENANLQRRIVEIQSLLDELNPEVVQKNAQLKNQLTWKEQVENKINQLNNDRQQERELHSQRIREHEFAQMTITSVKRLFTEDQSLSLFLQEKEHQGFQTKLDQVIQSLQKAKQESENALSQKKSYAYMFQMFIQISEGIKTQADPQLVNKIVILCDKLLKNIEESSALDRKVDEKREVQYQAQKKLYEKDLNKIVAKIAQLNADLANLNDKITLANRDMTDTKERQSQKQKQVDDRQKECQEHAYLYKQARDQRTQNRGLTSQIIGLFSANQRDFADYVKLRTDAGHYK